MRNDVKELADAMERGWNLVPRMCSWYFEDVYGRQLNDAIHSVHRACAQGHALLGLSVRDISLYDRHDHFPILRKQNITYGIDELITLETAINQLVMDCNWTTPQVVAWLRSHQ